MAPTAVAPGSPSTAEPGAPGREAATERTRAPMLREAVASVVRRIPPKARDEETEAERAAREAAAEDVVEIAISSEQPVRRYDWWRAEEYDEVLGHGKDEVDLSYARDGIPLFVGHREWDMVGLVEDVRLDADRVIRGTVRFSKSRRAQEIEQDIRDGIRKKISAGYDYADSAYSEEKREGQPAIRRYTGWRLLEASSVPIPADYDVGVGRSAHPGAPRPQTDPGRVPATQEIRVTTAAAAPSGAHTNEAAEIAARATQHGLQDRLAGWLTSGRSLADVEKEILEYHRDRTSKIEARGGGDGVVQLNDKEEKQYSLLRALRGAVAKNRTGFEFEVSQDIAKKLGRDPSSDMALFVPTNMKRSVGRPRGERAGLYVSSSAAGQELKFTEYGGFIGALRNRTLLTKMGARMLSGLQGDVGFVTQPSANTFTWGAETGTATATNFGTGLRTMAPKNGWASTQFSRQMLAQSVEDVEQLAWDDILKVVAIAIDLAGINGSGATNNPTGILNTTGIGSVTMGTNGGLVTFPKLVDLETEVTDDNADLSTMGYLTTPRVAGLLKQTQQFSGTNGVPIWTGTVHEGLVNGYRAAVTKQVPSNLTKGTSTGVCHGVVFGAYEQLYIGEWGAMEMIVDPYTLAPQQVKVSTLVLIDIFLRYVESFSAIKDATLS